MEYIKNVSPNREYSIEQPLFELMRAEIENTRHEIIEIMKQQQGMIFNFKKKMVNLSIRFAREN